MSVCLEKLHVTGVMWLLLLTQKIEKAISYLRRYDSLKSAQGHNGILGAMILTYTIAMYHIYHVIAMPSILI